MSDVLQPRIDGAAPEPVPAHEWTPESAQGELGGLSGLVDLVSDWLTATVSAIVGVGSWNDAQAAYDRAIGPLTQGIGMALAATSGAETELDYYGGAE
ncbi:hypothetical protein [Mycolicibacterium fortuitum]|uniref:hypothetical protein n=1 Tax=Mycolicibacterium fortuitum TaxID=1766 RepID=UPI000A821BA5|nr:hypothetical protein [Mycolicibacterium fortuitum]